MAEDVWTVKRILEWIEGYLRTHDDENPRLSAQWLVAEALGTSRMQLFLDLDRPLANEERAILRDYTRRRGAGEPLQYITGSVDFRHITVQVRPGVLIPRPETEVLVSEALALLPPAPKPQDMHDEKLLRFIADARAQTADENDGAVHDDDESDVGSDAADQQLIVADICTGSACIACSIAHEHARTRVIATDLSPAAIALARENVTALGLDDRVEVIECDLGSGIDPALVGTFDLIVSNPPYVPTSVLADMPREVAEHEPTLALDGGADGLDVFRRLLAWCKDALKPAGALAFELHETCLDDAAAEAREAGFSDVRIAHDLAGRPRILTARR